LVAALSIERPLPSSVRVAVISGVATKPMRAPSLGASGNQTVVSSVTATMSREFSGG